MTVHTLPPPVSALERRLGLGEGTLDGPDLARAEDTLADAAALVLAEAPSATARNWSTEAAHPVAVVTCLKAARREYLNPSGLTSESLGERSVAVGNPSGVYLSKRERAMIRSAALGRYGYVGSVRTPSAYTFEPYKAPEP